MTARMTGGGKIRNWRMIQWTCCVGDTRSSIRRWKCEGLKLRSLNTFHKESVSQVGNPDLFSWDHWFLMRNYTRHTWIFRRPWYLKRLWSWEGSGLGGKGDDRGWDGWMASPTRWTWVWTPGDGDGQGGLACCSSWSCKELDMTEWLNWTELKKGQKKTISIVLLLKVFTLPRKLSCCCFSISTSCLTLWHPMNCSRPCFSDLDYLLDFAQTYVHWVSDAIQPSHPLFPPSPALSPFQNQGLL